MTNTQRTWLVRSSVTLALVAVAYALSRFLAPEGLPPGIVGGNGRIEAVEVDVSAKSPGRIREILANEGDFVKAGQLVARMDVEGLTAQRAEAEAQLAQAVNGVQLAQSQVVQRQSERAAALAALRQREAELNVARKRYTRSETLAREGAAAVQQRDDDEAQAEGAAAAVQAARAQVAAIDAGIAAARSGVVGARSSVDAVHATIARIDTEIRDGELRAPVSGRVQYRVAQPGEVIGGGGRVVNLVNVADVFMTFFLPATVVGNVELGSDVRIVLDAAPDYVIPAKLSFVADVAQFTPKMVETQAERQKLMFRVRAQIDRDLLQRHLTQVKTGLPGMAYVRVDGRSEWPTQFVVNVPK